MERAIPGRSLLCSRLGEWQATAFDAVTLLDSMPSARGWGLGILGDKILLSPTCKRVWDQKTLGSGLKVDFVIQEADDTYTAIEIESPRFTLFTKKNHDPTKELKHAEKQIRDYCDFIDRNLEYVRGEEDLKGIFFPRGEIVIGRRKDLTGKGARSLCSLNQNRGRFKFKKFSFFPETKAFEDCRITY